MDGNGLKIFKLRRPKGVGRIFGFVIAESSAQSAREMAASSLVPDEFSFFMRDWYDPALTSCEVIGTAILGTRSGIIAIERD